MTRRVALVAACAVLIGGVRPGQSVGAQAISDSALEARTTQLAGELRCPVCQGSSIQDSPSELARQMRSLVRDQLRAGKSPVEIKAYFVSKYGEFVLGAPEAKGFNLVLYALPFVLILGGLAAIFFAVRRWTRKEAPG